MKLKLVSIIWITLFSSLLLPINTKANYTLVIGSYRQGTGGKPHVSGITSPSLFAIPMESKEICNEAGIKIENAIYKPVWQFDSKWTCVFNGNLRK